MASHCGSKWSPSGDQEGGRSPVDARNYTRVGIDLFLIRRGNFASLPCEIAEKVDAAAHPLDLARFSAPSVATNSETRASMRTRHHHQNHAKKSHSGGLRWPR